jgi:GNAT superfamily N-acetyltransferase
MTARSLSLEEALALDRLEAFIRQEEARGAELVKGSDFERALALVIGRRRSEARSETGAHRNPTIGVKELKKGSPSNRIGSIEAQPLSLPETGTDASTTTLTVAPANLADASAVVDVIAAAFLNDPTWSWAFPDPAVRRHWWKLCIDGALRYPWTFKTNGFETVSIWIPPSRTEFSQDGKQRIPSLLEEVGSRASEVAELLRRFDQAHPQNEPHYYLSLLGTRDEHRGRGLGMALLKENLARIDAERMPAYLESSNPGNNHRYESVGFISVVSFRAPGDGPVVTGMWRESR